jgi:UDP-N-acetylglucosamine 3-dehydrogenase
MSGRVNIGIVGCGDIAEGVHIPNVLSIAEARLAALCDANEERLWRVGGKFNVVPENLYSRFQDILQRQDVDAVVICTNNESHAPISIAAAQAGKHVFVEKPMALNSSEATAMIQAAEQHKVKLMVGHYFSFLPNHLEVKRLIQKGTIGQVFFAQVHGETLVMKPEEGMLLDYASHCVDLLRWYFDNARIKQVAALLQPALEGGEGQKEAHSTLMVRFSNGIVGQVGNYWVPGYKNWDVTDRCVRILGTKGKILTGFTTPGVTVYSAGTLIGRVRGLYQRMPRFAMHPDVPVTQTSYRRELEDFVDSIRQDREPLVTGYAGLTVLRVLEAARQSCETGMFVEVEE